tara:strand:- start:72 stop:320 length:249 start_codon:yes stop_codon:yes gene_type:complete
MLIGHITSIKRLRLLNQKNKNFNSIFENSIGIFSKFLPILTEGCAEKYAVLFHRVRRFGNLQLDFYFRLPNPPTGEEFRESS